MFLLFPFSILCIGKKYIESYKRISLQPGQTTDEERSQWPLKIALLRSVKNNIRPKFLNEFKLVKTIGMNFLAKYDLQIV